jgi:branched-chain amino acid transport system ATP-binding protein
VHALLADSITAGYGKVPVISDVSLRAKPGSLVALIGPNGAGKSTFLKAIYGLLRETTGRVEVAGKDVSRESANLIAGHGMTYLPQVNNVFVSLTIVENLEMGAYLRPSGTAERIEEVLEFFPDLARARGKRAGNLSGGQRNMLGFARCLMVDPKVILLDEPTAGLSPTYTATIWEQAARIAATGTAVVVVEQNVDMALAHADWVYVLVAGRNRLDGPADEVSHEDLAGIFLGKNSSELPKKN